MDNSTLIGLAVVVALAVVGLITVLLLLRQRRRKQPKLAHPVGLPRTAGTLGPALRRAWGAGVDDSTWVAIEEALLAADVGVEATSRIIKGTRATRPRTPEDARGALSSSIRSELGDVDRSLHERDKPSVWLVIGVNGTGKTTTVAKLAKHLVDDGKTVTLGAADTYRAAAAEQLQLWGDRVHADVVTGQVGGDPASVAFDTIASARAKEVDVVIIDTAGRLHAKKNLMAELHRLMSSWIQHFRNLLANLTQMVTTLLTKRISRTLLDDLY